MTRETANSSASDDRQRRSKYKRDMAPRNFILTARDFEILKAVSRYRYLQTNQIKRLLFAGNKDNQAARNRLRRLYDHGYLGRIQPYVRIGEGENADIAYYLERKGHEQLEGEGVPIPNYATGAQVKHQFLQHALDVSEFRLNLELALADSPIVEIERFTADFELKPDTRKLIGKERYALYGTVAHPVTKQSYIVYPDALIILRGKGKHADVRRLLFVEIDRSTEGLNAIKDKVTGYAIYKDRGLVSRHGVADFRVLFQTNTEQRAQSIRRFLTGVDGTELVWITAAAQVTQDTIVTSPIWQDHELKTRAILKG